MSWGDIAFFIFLATCFLSIGWIGNEIYHDIKNDKMIRTINGLWLPKDNISINEALNYSYSRDTIGDWVCINIKGMTIQEMIDTCQHEASHEIFAEYCEKNATKCLLEVGGK